MSPQDQSKATSSGRFEDFGRRADRVMNDAARQVEEDAEKLITWINDELVPQIREHSSRGLRVASEKLSRFADYLESEQKR